MSFNNEVQAIIEKLQRETAEKLRKQDHTVKIYTYYVVNFKYKLFSISTHHIQYLHITTDIKIRKKGNSQYTPLYYLYIIKS